MSKYYFTYRIQTMIEADSPKEAAEMYDSMSLAELFAEEDTFYDSLDNVQDENYKDVTQECYSLM